MARKAQSANHPPFQIRGPGCIDTTPLDYADGARAQSKYLTKDPDDLTNANLPADEDGKPTYVARDGATGEKGGSVTLHVGQLINEDPNKTRFVCRGGKGQNGEAGRLKKYVSTDYSQYLPILVYGNGQRFSPSLPEKYGPLNPVTENDLASFLQDNNFEKLGPDRFRWPGGDSPGQMTEGKPPAGQLLRTGKVVKVDLYVRSDFVVARYVERSFLPSRAFRRNSGSGRSHPVSNKAQRGKTRRKEQRRQTHQLERDWP